MSDKSRQKHILAVDGDTNMLRTLKTVIGSAGHILSTAPNGETALRHLSTNAADVILLNVDLPDMSGYELIKKIKSNAVTSHVPVIFLTANDAVDEELEGLNLGAIDCIRKSTHPLLILKRIEVHILVESQNQKIVSQQQELLFHKQQLTYFNSNLQQMVDDKTEAATELKNTLLKQTAVLVEYRDDPTGRHIDRIQGYISILLDAMQEQDVYSEKLSTLDFDLVIQTSALHDVGKVAVKESILLKPGRLTDDEYEEIKKHTTIGKKIIERAQVSRANQAFFEYAKTFAVSHHEQWNGKGYPYGLAGKDIPLLGRIMALADVYDALVSKRPYKNALSHEKAVDIIMADREKQFDPAISDVFFKVSDKFKDVKNSLL